jgi:2-amino-4-hydroxy-6-hydroxymethyldihydropteridine diphosphokinase
MTVVAYIGVGSNQGDRRGHCAAALAHIAAYPHTTLIGQSSYYLTEPWGYREQDDFVNLVLKVETEITPLELLGFLKETEGKLARQKTIRFGPRTIDLDILLYGDRVILSPELTIPHARLCERAFVLIPLQEIAPQLMHPVRNQTISRLLAELDDTRRVVQWNRENQ